MRLILCVVTALLVGGCMGIFQDDLEEETGASIKNALLDTAFAKLPKKDQCAIARQFGQANLDNARNAAIALMAQAKADGRKLDDQRVREIRTLVTTMEGKIMLCEATLPNYDRVMFLIGEAKNLPADAPSINLRKMLDGLMEEYFMEEDTTINTRGASRIVPPGS